MKPETSLQKKCFELYYMLGNYRKLTDLDKECQKADIKVTYASLCNWNKNLFWEQRIKARDFDVTKTTKLSNNFDIEEVKQEYSKRLRNTLSLAFKTKADEKGNALDVFEINIRSMDALERAVKLLLLLNGEATDISTVRVEIVQAVINHVVVVLSEHIKDKDLLSTIAAQLQTGTKQITRGNNNIKQ